MTYVITTEAELRTAMQVVEHEHLEFKAPTSDFSFGDLCRYCVALSNEGGGSLVLGITNKKPRKVSGTDCFSDVNNIKHRLLDTLHFRVDVTELSLVEGRVLVFICPERPIGTPRHYKARYYMRSGESLVPMTPEMLSGIFAEATPDFSHSVCAGAVLDDLDPAAIQEFQVRWARKNGNDAINHLTPAQLLSDAQLLHQGGVTYAALVLLAKESSLRRLLPQAELIFEYRNSDASIEYQDRYQFRSGFFLWANSLWDKINLRNEKHSYRDGMFRYEIASLNEDVVREALLNAIAHREYRDGRSIFVRQFPQRLEIVSPGGFPTGVTEHNILHRHNARNRCIAEAFQFCGLVERSGQGADRMYRFCIQEGKSRPDYSASDTSQVSLTLSGEIRDPRFVEYLDLLATERNMSLTTNDFLALDMVRQGEVVPAELRGHLARLVEQGVVEKGGQGRGVRYILSHALYQHVGESGTYTRRKGLDDEENQELLLKHIRHSGSKGATLQEFKQVLTSKTEGQVKSLLTRLKKSGRVRVEGKTRGARWFIAPQ